MSTKKPNRKNEPTNIGVDPELKPIAARYFGATKYGSLTGFVNAALRKEFARGAAVIKAIGLQVPEQALKN